MVHNSNGTYTITWDTADTDTLGDMDWQIFFAGALMAYGTIEVVNQFYYDFKFGTDPFPVNVTQILGTDLAETTSGNFATNMTTFYDNADALTAKTVDDVGGKIFLGPVPVFSNGSTITTGTEVGTHTNTHELDSNVWRVNDNTGINAELLYNVDSGNSGPMSAYQGYVLFSGGNNRFISLKMREY